MPSLYPSLSPTTLPSELPSQAPSLTRLTRLVYLFDANWPELDEILTGGSLQRNALEWLADVDGAQLSTADTVANRIQLLQRFV
jgi:hypothetical protein